jgi:hypothetical protein
MPSVDIPAEFVVAAAEVLDEGVPGTDHSCRAGSFQAAHRPQQGLQALMSGDVLGRSVHLLAADQAFQRGLRADTFAAVCGEVLTSAPDSGEDPVYCPQCVHAAIRWCALGNAHRG